MSSADDFELAAMLAGYFVAHGIWSVSEGARFAPMVAHEGPEGRGFQKFVGDDGGTEARRAAEWLSANPMGAERAVMVVDGFAELDGVGRDALIAHVIEYGPELRSLHIVVPYRPKESDAGFAVHSPRFGGAENIDLSDLEQIGDAFFSGVVAHTAASPIWTANLDESV
jgi:hypothetical protein